MTSASHIGRELKTLSPSAQFEQITTILGYLDPHVQEAVRNGQEAHPRLPLLPGRGSPHGLAPGCNLEGEG